MAQKQITYNIVVNTANGKVKIDGLTDGFVQADLAAKKLNTTLSTTSKNAGQVASKAGLAGALVVELGRTASDANYGMTAMANNLQQVSTLFVTLIATSGGLTNAMKLLWSSIAGPLGLILAFQLLITMMESNALSQKASKTAVDDHTKALKEQYDAVKALNEVSRYHVEATKDIVMLEEQLADTKLYDPDNWKKIASIREQIIDKQLLLLKAEKASAADLMTPQELLKINSEIYRLEQERERVRSEAFKNRKKEKGMDTGLMGLTPESMDLQLTLAGDLLENERILEAQRTAQAAAAARGREIIAYNEAEARKEAMMEIGYAMQDLGVIFGEQTTAGKAVAVAGALINTYLGVTKAIAQGGFLGIARGIAVATFGLAQVKRILDVKVPGKSGSSGSQGSTGDTVTPQFNVIGATGPNRIAEAVRSEMSKPTKAYVTTKDIRSGQELERNTRSGATL